MKKCAKGALVVENDKIISLSINVVLVLVEALS